MGCSSSVPSSSLSPSTATPGLGQPQEVGKTFDVDVCAVTDLRDGEMREVTLKKDTKALVVKDRGAFYAIGNKCTHYGAPLVNGAVCNGRVRCPWHGACFRLDTGDIEEFPGLDSLPRYEVCLTEGRVKVRVGEAQLGVAKRVKPLQIAAHDNDDVVVIVGGGAAGATAAETLRQEGYEGRLLLLSRDPAPPYDRTKLSKAMDAPLASIRLRDDHFYAVYDIELRLGKQVVRLDAGSRLLHLDDGDTVTFTKLLLAPGLSARSLVAPGADLPDVHTLRTAEDAAKIAAGAKGKRVVVLGSSFVALEAAAFLVSRAASVTVVMRGETPFHSSLGQEVGSGLRRFAEKHGVKFVAGDSVERVEGDGKVSGLLLVSGTRLDADLVLAGLGASPDGAADFVGSQVDRDSAGYVLVNERMETSSPGVFAAGDVTAFPLLLFGGTRVRIGHWSMAQQQGRVAALNMLGRGKDLLSVPFFWSVLFGKSVRFAGHVAGHTETLVHGDLDEPKFVAFYLRDDKVVGAASMNFDPVVAQVAEMMAAQRAISRHEIADDPLGFVKRMGGAAARQ